MAARKALGQTSGGDDKMYLRGISEDFGAFAWRKRRVAIFYSGRCPKALRQQLDPQFPGEPAAAGREAPLSAEEKPARCNVRAERPARLTGFRAVNNQGKHEAAIAGTEVDGPSRSARKERHRQSRGTNAE
ncbi:hypothetical protein MTO96_011634 [Rhipicephalus appendiculatus]